jgi:NAD(P) transhydrogenase
MADTYDLVVVGAGPAGQSAAELTTQVGRRVLVVEQHQPGGVVTTTGGAPTKTLREAALYLTGFRQEEVYGIRAAVPLEVALPIIAARVTGVRDRLQGVVARQLAERGVDYLRGAARLGPDGAVLVTMPDGVGRELVGRTILVATGSRPTHFPGIPFDDPDVYDSDQIYSIRTVPKQIVIVGGGPIGVEFATVFTALGIWLTLVSQADRLLPTMDGELAELLADEFQRRGVRLVLGAGADAVARIDGQLTVTLSTGAVLPADAVLFAAGRTPHTEGLGLEQVGVRLDPAGHVVVDRYYRTTAAGIYAAGDVIGPALASNATQQGRAAACHACGLVFGIAVDQAASTAVYGLPEVAGVGATEEQVRAAGIPYVVGRCDLAMTARGAIAGHGGRLKLIFRADDRKLLGVHCIGDLASEVVGLGHVALHVGGAVELFLTLGLNTPTYSHAYHDAAVDGLTQLAQLLGHDPGATSHRRAAAPATVTAAAEGG